MGGATKLIPYTDAFGRRRAVRVAADVAGALDTYDRWVRKRTAMFRARHVNDTDRKADREDRPDRERAVRVQAGTTRLVGYLNYDLEPTTAGLLPPTDGGEPWDGPRFPFPLLLGEGPPWAGPDSLRVTADGGETWTCRFCGHLREAPAVAYCLACDRSGRDDAIPRVTPYDRKRREERRAASPSLPAPARDRTGKALRGGMAGKK